MSDYFRLWAVRCFLHTTAHVLGQQQDRLFRLAIWTGSQQIHTPNP